MAREYYVEGERMVYVQGRAGSGIEDPQELGMTSEPIKLIFNYRHQDIRTDDYGTMVPAEIITNLAEATIIMPLIHFDKEIAEICISESICMPAEFLDVDNLDGQLTSAGTPMGCGAELYSEINHFITVLIASLVTPAQPLVWKPWRFLACYITDQIELPIGTEASVLQLTWRAIPYTPLDYEISSSDVVLFDHNYI